MASNEKAAAKEKAAHKDSKAAPKDSKAAPKEKKAPKEKAAAKVATGGETKLTQPPRLQTFYREKVVPDLMKKFGFKSSMQVPRLQKITLNMGVSEAVADKKVMDHAVADLTKISGQKPVVTKSRKAIAAFKIRENVPIGTMVTLRGIRMYEFLDRFVTIALPRVRDFRGISGRSFDGRGNYNVGVKEQIIFPEVEYDKVEKITGLNVTVCTTARNDAEGKALLTHLGMPFRQ
jgi:large subunit ribosomal protein L5